MITDGLHESFVGLLGIPCGVLEVFGEALVTGDFVIMTAGHFGRPAESLDAFNVQPIISTVHVGDALESALQKMLGCQPLMDSLS